MERYSYGDLVWLHLDDPGAADVAALCEATGVPRFALEVARRDHHRPRLDTFDGHLLLVLRSATYLDPTEVIDIGQLAVIAGPRTVMTIGTGHAQLLEAARRRLEHDHDAASIEPAMVVHAIVERVVDDYAEVLEGLDTDVDEIETQVFSPVRGSHAERIYRLKSEVQQFRRSTGSLPALLDELRATPAVSGLDEHSTQPYDVRMRASRAAEHVSSLDELLNSILSAHLAQIGVQQNNDMRRISAWVAIVAAPTAMASIYGMNFDVMPELTWRYGYFVILGVMATVCLGLYRSFRRSGWL